jgi:hypothetical protein
MVISRAVFDKFPVRDDDADDFFDFPVFVPAAKLLRDEFRVVKQNSAGKLRRDRQLDFDMDDPARLQPQLHVYDAELVAGKFAQQMRVNDINPVEVRLRQSQHRFQERNEKLNVPFVREEHAKNNIAFDGQDFSIQRLRHLSPTSQVYHAAPPIAIFFEVRCFLKSAKTKYRKYRGINQDHRFDILKTDVMKPMPTLIHATLWGVALCRLLIPFSVPAKTSVFGLIEYIRAQTSGALANMAVLRSAGDVYTLPNTVMSAFANADLPDTVLSLASPLLFVWLAGTAILGAHFMIVYFKCRREFSASLPCDNGFIKAWHERHRLKRAYSVRVSDKITVPLTCGVFRPVILIPNRP